MSHDELIIPPGKHIGLKDYDPGFTGKYKNKQEAVEKLQKDLSCLSSLQEVLYAQNRYSLLLIFQAMDAAGKDSVIKHVMSGINPQGCQVYGFKAPSHEELDHDFLWRCLKCLPERGRIGIFNRSYYEEVLIVRVHPQFLDAQHLPPMNGRDIWKERYEDINCVERYLARNGTVILKFFLNVSREEQKQRFLRRIEEPEKHWKFSAKDVAEREHWKDYMDAYESMLNHTSTEWAPWYVIPADRKWFTRAAVADIITSRLEKLDLHFPRITEEGRQQLAAAKVALEKE